MTKMLQNGSVNGAPVVISAVETVGHRVQVQHPLSVDGDHRALCPGRAAGLAVVAVREPFDRDRAHAIALRSQNTSNRRFRASVMRLAPAGRGAWRVLT
jgi:hypothetical protein